MQFDLMPFVKRKAGRACWRKIQRITMGCLAVLALLVAPRLLAGTGDYLIDVWTSENGLPNSSVTAIAQTGDGYLWVGTYNGLARFDGVRFVTFDPANTPELKHARVAGLFVDAEGTLWINTYDGSMTAWRHGVFSREWQGGQVSSVFSRSNQVLFAVLRGELVCGTGHSHAPGDWKTIKLTGLTTGYSFCEDQTGTLWYLMRNGTLGRVRGTNSESLPPGTGVDGQKVNSLTADRNGHIWIGTDKSIAVWDGQRFVDQTPTNSEPQLNVSFLFATSSNGCWVFANGRARKCLDRRWVAEADSLRDLAGSFPSALRAYEDREGGVWFRHFGLGLYHARPDGAIQRISKTNGLPGDRVSCWFQDREGNLWAGVDRGGLVRLREKRFQVIGPAQGLPAQAVSSVCEDGLGNVWIGTFGGGLNRWRDGALKRFDLPEGASKDFFFSVFPDSQNRLWLSAGREDLFVYENERITQLPTPVHGVKAILADRKGRVWLGKNSGLACWADGALKNYGTNDGIGLIVIRALAEDQQGGIWVGAEDGGLYEFKDGKFTLHQAEDGLAGQAIWSLLVDDEDTLWVGTFRGGLLRFKEGRFTRYTTKNGLPSDIVCQILDDGLGNLWVGSQRGIFHVPKTKLRQFADGEIESVPCVSCGLYDGLPALECSGNYQPSCWRSRDGRLWFATVKGAVSTHPEEVHVNYLPPPVVIEEIVVDGKPILGNEGRIDENRKDQANRNFPASAAGLQKALQIPPGDHQFEFRYAAPSYVAPQNIRFRYKLEGLDNKWVEAGDRRSVPYSHLKPGDYRFCVMACNNDGFWNEAGATVALKVSPHFWETWWFRTLLSLAVGGTLVGVARFAATRKLRRQLERLEQQRAIERDRMRIAKDIHDDLGAGLTQIMLQSALARREPTQETQMHLTQISDTASDLIRAMDEIVWAINPQNDTLDGLGTYICKFTHEYLTAVGVRCRLDVPGQLPLRSLSSETRHNLFLAIKEALNNVLKHSGATEVWLHLALQPSGFTITIKDNGCGFKPGATADPAPAGGRIASGQGLRNMAKRLETIGGVCTVKSAPGKGTSVELVVNFEPGHSPILASSQKGRDDGE